MGVVTAQDLEGTAPVAVPSRVDVVGDLAQRVGIIEQFSLQERQQFRAENGDLKRRVDYLVGELKRRDALEAPRRRWWRA